jgi:hypothetical protein
LKSSPYQRFEIIKTRRRIIYQKIILGKSTIFHQQRIWGTSVGGKETLTSNQALPSEAIFSFKKEGEESTYT